MQVKWGNAALPANAAEVTAQLSVTQFTDGGAPLRYLVAWNVLGYLEGTGQADLSAKEAAFRAALLKPGQDFGLYLDSGAMSCEGVVSARTVTGTRVVNVSAPEAQGAEFVNRRTIGFTVTAELDVANTARAVVSWAETVTVQGNGGPRRAWCFPVNGPAFRQVVAPYSLVRATQSGAAVGYRARPAKPRPLFPDYLVNEAVTGSVATPQLLGGGYVNYPVQWSYTFERGDGPLVGMPLLPPGVL